MKKAQYSVEYVFVIAFALGVVLIASVVYFQQTKSVSEEEQLVRVEVMARDLLALSENVYYAGGISKKTARYTMPSIVNNIYVEENMLVFNVTAAGATYDLLYPATVPVEGDFPDTKDYTYQISDIIVRNEGDHAFLCSQQFTCT